MNAERGKLIETAMAYSRLESIPTDVKNLLAKLVHELVNSVPTYENR